MQQDRTFIPGVDENLSNDLYSRRATPNGNPMSGTFVPGMQGNAPTVTEQGKVRYEEPVVGFLYSISRKGIGEYWPLHLGANTIGRSADCDVRLREMSVSSLHARISIKQMKTTGALIATIRDEGSRTGMYVNDEELDYDLHNCKSGDIITVGANYQLILLLINAKELGLTVSEDFVADNEEDVIPEASSPAAPIDINATNTPYRRQNRPSYDGTVDLSGASFNMGGDTQIL